MRVRVNLDLYLFLIVFLAVVSPSCSSGSYSKRPELMIHLGEPMRFEVVGSSGLVDYFAVSNPNSSNAGRMCWQIAPITDTEVSSFHEAGPIIYGKVPQGFRQVIPEKGEPEPLSEASEYPYSVTVAIRNNDGVSRRFVLRSGKLLIEGEGSSR